MNMDIEFVGGPRAGDSISSDAAPGTLEFPEGRYRLSNPSSVGSAGPDGPFPPVGRTIYKWEPLTNRY